MPRLWTETIDAHKLAVRTAVLDSVADLAATQGLTGVTMSGVAARSGIGRATLYKYFPDVRALLLAWHERLIDEHLAHVEQALTPSARHEAPAEQDVLGRLRAGLRAYGTRLRHSPPGLGTQPDYADAGLHGEAHVYRAERRLAELFARHLSEAQAQRAVRDDVPAPELAGFCLSAMSAAQSFGEPTPPALERLLDLVIAALRAPAQPTR